MDYGCHIAEISSPKIHSLYDYWMAKRGSLPMPRRRDINAADLKPLLPQLIISEFETEPFRVRYRLVGTRVAEICRLDYTGLYLDELDFGDSEYEDWYGQYVWIFENRAPIFGRSETPCQHGKGTAEFEFATLPLTVDGSTVVQCLELEDYSPLDPLIIPTLQRTVRTGAGTPAPGGDPELHHL